jgi:hypothetical protein
LLIAVFLTGCSLIQREQVSVSAGYEYFHLRAIGSRYTTGIPYALWLAALEEYPDKLGKNWADFAEKFGVIADPDNPNGLPVGFVLEHDSLSGTQFLMTNCSLCHTAMIGNRRIDGLGARNLRLNALNNTVMRLAARNDFNAETLIPAADAIAQRHQIPWDWRSRLVAKRAIQELKELSSRHVEMDAGPGRSAAVEFTKAAAEVRIEPPFGFVRFHAVWTYSKRRSFGVDGVIEGDLALAAALVEFNKRMPPGYIVNHRERFYSIYEYIKTLRPPSYPGVVDTALADRGHRLFQTHCASCHGTYGPDETARYEERIIPLSEVGTDPDRLHAVTRALVEAFNRNELGKRAPMKLTDGYIGRPLDGIWSRGPYLHNGSVPTLRDLLRPASERPATFYVGGDTDYDLKNLGLAYEEVRSPDGTRGGRRASPRQSEFDTRSPGNGNGGHAYGTGLSAKDRRALLEYLKLL